nr:LysM peptidoglycan-binding domain-containing protein [uncultured Algibacter sp.]
MSGAANTGKVYTVLKGDTQYSISKKHNISVKELQDLNGLGSTNLNVGQVLIVSSSGNDPQEVKKTSSPSKPVSSSGKIVHKVVKGDTQYSISKKYNLTVKELQNMNGLKNTSISIGQILVVKP